MSSQHRTLGSVSDLMAGLMMVFLFIAIAYMIEVRSSEEQLEEQNQSLESQVEQERKATEEAERQRKEAELQRKEAELQKMEAERQRLRAEEQEKLLAELAESLRLQGETIREIAVAHRELQTALHEALKAEFERDLPRWKASLERDNTIRFNEPEVLFLSNSSEIRAAFREILDDFFPRYVRVLRAPQFIDEIDEVRVEGHTSQEWVGAESLQERYLLNARLSQERALSVLDHCFRLLSDEREQGWLVRHLRANGLSFARPVTNGSGAEDRDRSRRVEFRAITRSHERIERIIEKMESTEKTEETPASEQ